MTDTSRLQAAAVRVLRAMRTKHDISRDAYVSDKPCVACFSLIIMKTGGNRLM
jgi:hypothetical protein